MNGACNVSKSWVPIATRVLRLLHNKNKHFKYWENNSTRNEQKSMEITKTYNSMELTITIKLTYPNFNNKQYYCNYYRFLPLGRILQVTPVHEREREKPAIKIISPYDHDIWLCFTSNSMTRFYLFYLISFHAISFKFFESIYLNESPKTLVFVLQLQWALNPKT